MPLFRFTKSSEYFAELIVDAPNFDIAEAASEEATGSEWRTLTAVERRNGEPVRAVSEVQAINTLDRMLSEKMPYRPTAEPVVADITVEA